MLIAVYYYARNYSVYVVEVNQAQWILIGVLWCKLIIINVVIIFRAIDKKQQQQRKKEPTKKPAVFHCVGLN